ncbi:fasciclin domain-containing protein [Flavobacterium paronense]|uniref:Fasciclin domain-containing protein n=1 Tax=Flavobacterium paronense TaxID=1392775 RepID=A0ABV5GH78_9FLAO|nr:fasciclin domain-containing protein [Flavobacterium paronense]MDN3676535.1 fasciclin domain-containing protein [Flavobacterium paronense]
MKKLTKIIGIAFLSLTIFSCSSDSDSQPTIVDIASGNSDFSTLVTALNRTGLTATLDGSGQFTVFAPTNTAFQNFFATLGPSVTVENVDVDVLKKVLLNHVIGSEIKSSAIPESTYVSTLSPFSTATNAPTISMFVQKSGNTVTINGGSSNGGTTVTTADLDASNGVIHVVGNVIAIPTIKNHAIANPNFSTLTSLLVAQGLVPTLDGTEGSPFTVFAPINTAFDTATLALYGSLDSTNKTAVLLYHVVGGVNVRSNAIPAGNITTLQGQTFSITGTSIDDAGSTVNKNIILTDVQCSNGIVHAIDKVLLPNLN